MRFWACLNATIWFAGLIVLCGALLIKFNDTNPESPEFDGLRSNERTEILTTFFEIYLPYLGIIVGSATILKSKKKPRKRFETLLSVLVVLLGLCFNLYHFISFFDFMQSGYFDYKPLLQDLRTFATWLAFIVTAAMSYFFDLSH